MTLPPELRWLERFPAREPGPPPFARTLALPDPLPDGWLNTSLPSQVVLPGVGVVDVGVVPGWCLAQSHGLQTAAYYLTVADAVEDVERSHRTHSQAHVCFDVDGSGRVRAYVGGQKVGDFPTLAQAMRLVEAHVAVGRAVLGP